MCLTKCQDCGEGKTDRTVGKIDKCIIIVGDFDNWPFLSRWTHLAGRKSMGLLSKIYKQLLRLNNIKHLNWKIAQRP